MYLNDNQICKNKNEIKLTLKIENKTNSNNECIYFLDNTDNQNYIENNEKIYHNHDNLQELNVKNSQLFINDKEYSYQKYFIIL